VAVKVRKPFVVIGLVAACALLFGLLETLQYYVRSTMWGQSFDWMRSIAANVSTSFVLAALTPIAFFTSRRFRLERPVIAQRLAIHALAGVVFAFAGVAAVAALVALPHPNLSYVGVMGKLLTFYVLFYFAIYWVVVGAIHTAHYYHQTQLREERLVRERLEVLRSKLNPHFLFNTLNAISTMALQRDHEGVAQSLGLVGDMLRASLDDSLPQEISLAREMELTEKYIAIQRIRFGERLVVERAIEKSSLDALVPSMLLQPIIENAVVHGVGAKPGQGWVRIESSRGDGYLMIAVSDSGAGFSPTPRNGIGLTNTRERLQTMYGSEHRFEVGTVAGGGARVEIRIPVRNR
jgi:two-component system, LytTR family, sensor kinase